VSCTSPVSANEFEEEDAVNTKAPLGIFDFNAEKISAANSASVSTPSITPIITTLANKYNTDACATHRRRKSLLKEAKVCVCVFVFV
jgi:hypothetical protein